uniref:Lipoprotein n=1 Tax=Leersia perrieri TaxID=77586 RepID=A0A0D9X3E6_9ORYZ
MAPTTMMLLLFACAKASKLSPPAQLRAYEWPEQYHAVVVSNLTKRGGRLQVIEMYYDWPRGHGINIVREQLGGVLYNVEWTNGSSFLFDPAASTCRSFHFAVGILPPDWIAHGAVYHGRDTADGFDCHVWSNFLFQRYYADIATGRPVRWIFNGITRHVLLFQKGRVINDSSKWQAPPYCFSNTTSGDVASAPAPR